MDRSVVPCNIDCFVVIQMRVPFYDLRKTKRHDANMMRCTPEFAELPVLRTTAFSESRGHLQLRTIRLLLGTANLLPRLLGAYQHLVVTLDVGNRT